MGGRLHVRLDAAGWVYVAFVIDAYARRILGWKVSTSMTNDLVLAAINQAIFTEPGRRQV